MSTLRVLRAAIKRAARVYVRACMRRDGGVDFQRLRDMERDIADAWSIEVDRELPAHLRGLGAHIAPGRAS